MKHASKSGKTKHLLVETTKVLIMEKGCNRVTISDIMERSGLSKGAVYHHVKSKDELLALILQERLEKINKRFFLEVNPDKPEFEGPLYQIVHDLPLLTDPNELTNQIFMYLISRNDQPMVKEILRSFYEQGIQNSKEWISQGQQAGVISSSVDKEKTSELFTLITYGLRIRSLIAKEEETLQIEALIDFMRNTLRTK
ncbi:TetR/AcrR family transcriptional regulator [Hazenella sp. IB182357]|uniref:TetR/AcrR family transcriptional regulator n=1 Tax=Polycladospora coralii TaxID=2771432 RepID=A0A926NDP5_9BACL|nr:TetR/AcrR family transcriptional regulator [Polycladospora coralii]MBD1373930.1 TetR/AcrR family transcriptional regulator [Polycladospora coralii]MBS7531998.1 TetR/AcrR family transcriptional regulator [Polycladospora coralii]